MYYDAVSNGDINTIFEAIRYQNMDVNIIDPLKKWNALTFAIINNQYKTAKLLLSIGANPNVLSNEGKTALWNATRQHDLNLLKLLLDNGADPNLARGHFTRYCTGVAIIKGHIDSIKLIFSDNGDKYGAKLYQDYFINATRVAVKDVLLEIAKCKFGKDWKDDENGLKKLPKMKIEDDES